MKHITLKDGRIKEFSKKMDFMGIINVTDNSFYSGSRTYNTDDAIKRAKKLIEEGATFLDIGGESTRPGSDPVDAEEEINRVCPVIKEIKKLYPEVLLSVDTYRSKTALAAIENGVDIINDISGLTFDENMVKVIAETKVPLILMHIKGKPKTMHVKPHYDNVVKEVYEFLEGQINYAYENGVEKNKIIIDLGIGFGKNAEHNIELLKNISYFDTLNLPHLLAVSRKKFIGKVLNYEDAKDRLFGTIGISVYARTKGIEIARVHDVKENLEAVRMVEEFL
ncbi:dihydropteroate synthase [Miniphocaeibacter halophilus]|uniref:Dihydropteroate synthase n=1 Tax=Miniphocaeibacter halophilus TaxID=2931922 RepID=A0AC61MS06_9FIRM|nr:dihydropteroate synthase [Miniphocaeibacter halophilus]QQK07234.1 dihydropteroate synthase [Miniphocaeibacter halophilus]